MKTVLPWLVAALALGAAALFYNSDRAKARQLANLQVEHEAFESLRSENAELRTAQVSVEELERLRKNTDELLRLRNEVRQLRDDKQLMARQAETAQAAAQRAEQAAQAAQARADAAQAQIQPLAPTASPPLTPEALQAQQQFRARYGTTQQATPEQTQTAACINHLRQIDAAKQMWALENRRPTGSLVNEPDLAAFFKSKTMPACPAGGSYTLSTIGYAPLCNIPGHAVPGR
jgi:hypothetical protein